MRIKLVHDLIAFLIAFLTGIIVSYYYPYRTSMGVLLFIFSTWLITTSYFMVLDLKHALDPRLARSSTGSILMVISLIMILLDMGVESRMMSIIIVLAIIALIVNNQYLSSRIKSSQKKTSN